MTAGEKVVWQEEPAWSTGRSVWSMVTQFSDLGFVAGLADANTSAMDRCHVVIEQLYRAQQ